MWRMENMRPNTIKDISRITCRINDGKFDRRIIALLLIKLRALYGTGSNLSDIADYVAHDYRNRGESYKLAETLMKTVGNFITPTTDGVHILIAPNNSEVVSQKELCLELYELLSPFGADKAKFHSRSFKIMCCILENVEDAIMYVKQKHKPYLTECEVSSIRLNESGVKYLTFKTKVIGNSEDGRVKMAGSSVARIFLQAVPDGIEPYNMGMELSTGG
jgi:hypothetical protein